MDIYKILESIKEDDPWSLSSSVQPSEQAKQQAQAIAQKRADDRVIAQAQIGRVGEDNMDAAEHHPRGAKFSGYWKGKQKSPPRTGQGVGGCEESKMDEWGIQANYTQGPGVDDSSSTIHGEDIEQEIREGWLAYLTEFGAPGPGATTPTGGGTNPIDAAKASKQSDQTKQNLQKLKSAGVNIPTNMGQAAKAATTVAQLPSGQNINNTDSNIKKNSMGIGAEVEKLAAGDPSKFTPIANAIKQAKSSQGTM